MLFCARSYRFDLKKRVLILGVLNITPDSFSDGGKFFAPKAALAQAKRLIQEGTDILDIGAESTRPGAKRVSAQVQLERLLPVLKSIRRSFKIPISVDTSSAEVAEGVLKEGASMINDTSLLEDARMPEVIRQFKAGFILMHRRGNPDEMQQHAHYKNVVREVTYELKQKIKQLMQNGVLKNQIAIDPGIGFSKTFKHNLEILNHLEKLTALNFPVCVGASRKSFLGKITGRAVGDREWATAATTALAVYKGARLVRVHSVALQREVIQTTQAILGV